MFAEEVEPTGAVPMELILERYRLATLRNGNKNSPQVQLPTITQPLVPGGPYTENDKRLLPRHLTNMFPGSVILKNEAVHFQSILNGW